MKLTKRIFALALALCMILCLSISVFAVDGAEETAPEEGTTTTTAESKDATFSKTYKITNEGTKNPAETFKFTFANGKAEQTNTTVTVPPIPDATVEYAEGAATVAGLEKSITVALSDIKWPDVGIYYYDVKETAGTTAGVTYDDSTLKLKVTVAYDEARDKYYTAFVTLSLEDKNKDGQTDVKTGGFTNEYSAGSLSVKKEVTGNMGDRNAYFNIYVTLTGEEGKTYNVDGYAVTGGSKTTGEDANPTKIKIGEKTKFQLKHDDTIVIANLPYGVTYTVEEDPYTGYEPKITYADEAKKKIDTASDTVTVTNDRTVGIDTGISLDSLPYIVALAVALGGAVVLFTRKRHIEE